MAFRESEILISHATRWCLARVVAATQPNGLDVKQTVDGLAEKIIDEWIKAQHPELFKLWNEREAINDRAHKAVNEKAS